MENPEYSLGSSAILRLSGCPIQFWLAAGNPDLFVLLRHREELQVQYTSLGKHLVEQIGELLVPDSSISNKDRSLALRIRRQLHNRQCICESDGMRLVELSRRLTRKADQLINNLEAAVRLSRQMATVKNELSQLTSSEPARLSRVAWELVADSQQGKNLLLGRNPNFYADMAARVRRGDPWSSKAMRRSSDYIWKIIDRAATKSTPRDWHGYVASISVSPDSTMLDTISLTEDVATVWCENVHLQRRALSTYKLEAADAETRIAVTPLNWKSEDHLQFLVVDQDDPRHMVEVKMRRTPLLNLVHDTLASGAKVVEEFEAEILPESEKRQRNNLLRFTEHLLSLGVLQLSTSLRIQRESWRPFRPKARKTLKKFLPSSSLNRTGCVAEDLSEPPGQYCQEKIGFLDVYRRTDDFLSMPFCIGLQRAIEQSQRILLAIEADQTSVERANALRLTVRDEPVPLLELLRKPMQSTVTSNQVPSRRLDWPPAANSASPYSQLLTFIASRADETTVVNLSRKCLDELGIPDEVIDWPLDYVLRLPRADAGFGAVLDEVGVAGMLDARFVGHLQDFNGSLPHADSYHRFLELLELKCDVKFIELLVPPLSTTAANAVRRPIYTHLWTGDPDISTYCTNYPSTCRYVPLNSIYLRRVGNRLIAEVDGHPICPVYHATRTPQPPWSVVANTLLAAAPLEMQWSSRRLHYSLDAFPNHNFMPRIMIDGQLVIAPKQWRIPSGAIWSPKSSLMSKIDALEQLRRRWQMPRWVFVSTGSESKPMSCDLESIRAIRILERFAALPRKEIFLVEMLPSPDQLLVSDQTGDLHDSYSSSIMLRLPCNKSPSSLASQLTPAFASTNRKFQ